MPSVLVGELLGVGFLALAGNSAVRRTIGAVLLALVAVHVAQHHRRPAAARRRVSTDRKAAHVPVRAPRTVPAPLFGGLAGFTTMVANAGGPAMALYLLAARPDKLVFLGTSAWLSWPSTPPRCPSASRSD